MSQDSDARDSVREMWRAFCAERPDLADLDTPYAAWHFCDNQKDADELVELVLAGQKRATAGALWSYEAEGEAIPAVGDFSVVTEWSGVARCVIRTIAIEIMPFDEVTEEFAATEGEGDGSLEYWRRGHWAHFTREAELSGRMPTPDMPVVCERFEAVFPVPAHLGVAGPGGSS